MGDQVYTREEQLRAGADYMTMLSVECGDLDYPRPVDAMLGWDLLTIEADRRAEWDLGTYDVILAASIKDVANWRDLY